MSSSLDALPILEVIVDRIDVGIFVVNEACELMLWNSFLECFSEHKASDVIGKNIFEAFPELPRPWLERKIQNVFILRIFLLLHGNNAPTFLSFATTAQLLVVSIICAKTALFYP